MQNNIGSMSTKIFIISLCLECIILNAQHARDPNRHLDHLERRYELHSSISNENFRDIWKHINQHAAQCCSIESYETHDSQNKQLKTGSLESPEFEKLNGKVNVLNKAFADEKKTVREKIESMKTTLKEFNRTCVAEIERLKMESGQTNDEPCPCSSKWIKIYENGPNGEEVFGDRNSLIQAALTGSSVKILANKNYLTNVQNLKAVSGHLMAQVLFHISLAGDKFQDNAYWWFVIASTTGHWYMSRYNVGEHTSRGDNEIKYGIEWFIRRPCETKPVARFLPDGTVASGSVKDVVTAVRNGYPIQVTSLSSGYTFPADSLEIHDDHVAAQSLWHLSKQFSSGKKRVIFQKKAYWYFTIWSTESKKEMSRWTVGKHESRGSSSDVTLSDWYVDPCWRLTFRHSKHGELIEGDKDHLIEAIRNGHRVRVVYNDFAFEPNVLSIANGDVYALSMDSVSKASFDKFEKNLAWIWRSVSTNGNLQAMKTPVGGSSNTFENEKVSVAWFVDKRKWIKTSSTSVKNLYNNIKNGADVRIQIGHLEKNDVIFIQPDNVHLSSDHNIFAMHIRQAPFLPTIVPAWVFTYTSTKNMGSIDTSIWTLGKHEQISHTLQHEPVVWFTSE